MRKRIYDLVSAFVREHGVAPNVLLMGHAQLLELIHEVGRPVYAYFEGPNTDPRFDGMKILPAHHIPLAVALVKEEAP